MSDFKDNRLNREKLKKILSDKNKVMPLSFGQKRLWFLNSMESKKSNYNITLCLKFDGELNISYLEDTLNKIVKRHAMLRANFKEVNGDIYQIVSTSVDFKLKLEKILTNKQIEFQNVLEEERKYEFDLERSSLIRFRIVQFSPKEFTLVIVMHHIISDGLSNLNLLNEIESIYSSYYNKKEKLLPELKCDYYDYVKHQNDWVLSKEFTLSMEYWKKHLKDIPEMINLPKEKKDASKFKNIGAYQRIQIKPHIIKELNRIAREKNCTLYMVLLAAFNILLSEYSGDKDILVGTPTSGREHSSTENMIGFFVNTLVIRTKISKEENFNDLLLKTKKELISAFTYGNVPFEKIVSELELERDIGQNPIFQVMFSLNKAMPKSIEVANMKMTPSLVTNGGAKFDLSLLLDEHEDESVTGIIEYNSELFQKPLINRFANNFEHILKKIISNIDTPLNEINFITSEELEMLYENLGEKEKISSIPKNIVDTFTETVKYYPDNIALKYINKTMTYTELDNYSNQISNYLLKRGVSENTLVGISLDRSINLIGTILAVLKVGATYVPIDPQIPQERKKTLINISNMDYLITQSKYKNEFDINNILIDDAYNEIIKESTKKIEISINEKDSAYVIFTSGSTGVPKGVKVSHYNVCRLFESTNKWFDFNEDDIWTLFHSYAFDFSVWEIFGSLLSGAKLIIVPYEITRSPEDFYTLIDKENVSILNQTPSAFRQLIFVDRNNKSKLSHLRKIIFGGESLDYNMLVPWVKKYNYNKPELINMYGITETTVHVTYKKINSEDIKLNINNIGMKIPDLKLYVMDDDENVVPFGVIGEIYVGGNGVAIEYLNQEQLTKERFINHPLIEGRLYKTGDLARYLENGMLEYKGRKDKQVKVRGFRIELDEIKSTLLKISYIQKVEIDVLSNNKRNKIVAFVTINEPITVNEIRGAMKEYLPNYMIPEHIKIVDNIPYTINGKINFKKLHDQEPLSDEHADTNNNIPRDSIEFEMQKIWNEIIEHGSIQLDDNFFEIGGNSLSLIHLQSKIKKKFNKEIKLAEMFRNCTIEGLSKKIRLNSVSIEQPHVIPLTKSNGKTPIFLVHPVGGYCFRYRHLAEMLSEKYSVYGIQVSDPEGDYTCFKEMAKQYIKELKNIQPQGRYVLVGYSLGGNIAIEMGTQLEMNGDLVDFITLIDTFQAPFLNNNIKSDNEMIIEYAIDRFPFTEDKIKYISTLDKKNLIDFILNHGKEQNYYREDMDSKQLTQVISIYVKHMTAWHSYKKPNRKFSSDILFIRALKEKQDSASNWDILLNKRMKLVDINAFHFEMIDLPHVKEVAKSILEYRD